MKNPEEIVEWLKSHDWYEEFVSNTKDYYKNQPYKVINILNGLKKEETIIRAFVWNDYPSEINWNKVNKEFIKWYIS